MMALLTPFSDLCNLEYWYKEHKCCNLDTITFKKVILFITQNIHFSALSLRLEVKQSWCTCTV